MIFHRFWRYLQNKNIPKKMSMTKYYFSYNSDVFKCKTCLKSKKYFRSIIVKENILNPTHFFS